ncbi:hypothetical protein MPLSOD_140171 [Mesorhizobium sp. SOD10]|nr:hypothetical protein MPLSOD_140171 [Mesorhizobium sp. SOD10]
MVGTKQGSQLWFRKLKGAALAPPLSPWEDKLY